MFRGINKLAIAHREQFVSLLLLPAFFFGTMPHTVCICSDGHREEFCKAALCAAISSGSNKSACCGCSCCINHGSQPVRACCRGKACQPASGGGAPVNGIAAKTGSCCHPFIEAPKPGTTSSKADLDSQLVLNAASLLPATFIIHDDLQPTMLDRSSFSTPPPLDAVIVFLHLTI
jgi:hypothetical protein